MSNTESKNDETMDLSELSFGDYLVSAGDAKVGFVKLLTYGVSGSGKTTLISTMPDPMIVLLTEKHGEMTVKRVNPKAHILHIEDKVDKRGRAVKARDVLYDAIDDLASKNHPFISVALDSLTDLQQIFLSDMKGGKAGADISLKEWGRLIDQTKHLVVKLRNLNMHVALICLADEVQDNQQRMIYRPALAGKKLPGAILQYFNLVTFQRKSRDPLSTAKAIHESVFDAGDEYYTKSHPALDPVEPPNIRNMVDKMQAYSLAHGEGDIPSTSSPVSLATAQQREEDSLRARLHRNPKIKDAFDTLNAPDAKRLATLRKYKDDDKLLETLLVRIKEAQEAEAKEAKEKEAEKAADQEAVAKAAAEKEAKEKEAAAAAKSEAKPEPEAKQDAKPATTKPETKIEAELKPEAKPAEIETKEPSPTPTKREEAKAEAKAKGGGARA